MADEIEKLRGEIDRLDDELAALVQRRAGLAQKIGALKGGAPAYRPGEGGILQKVSKVRGPLAGERIAAVFREIISACRGLEEAIRVSYLGPEGTFSEQAVRKHFGRAVDACRRRRSTRRSGAASPARRSSPWCRWRTPPKARSAARSTCSSRRRFASAARSSECTRT